MAKLVGRTQVGLLLIACVLGARADPIVVQPRVSLGQQAYELRFDDVLNSLGRSGFDFRDGFKVNDQLPFAAAGITVTANRLFLDVSGQRSKEGHDRTYQFSGRALGNDIFAPGDGHNHQLDIDLEREELNATVGWGFTDVFSAYIGFKRATVDMQQRQSPLAGPDPGDILFIGDYDMEFIYEGLFVGATYVVPVGDAGALSLQSTVARLDGDFSQRFSGRVLLAAPTASNSFNGADVNTAFRDGVVRGDSVGVNVGISWTGQFFASLPALSYTIGLDHSRYEFDSSGSQAFWAADFNEKTTRLRLDLRYRLAASE